MRRSILTLAGFILMMVFFGAQAGDAKKGQSLSGSCATCHGSDGNSLAGAFPKLAGQGERYLLKQMQDIRSGVRAAPLMAGQLDQFSDSELADIATYYAAQTVTLGAAKADSVAAGEAIYRAGIARKQITACSACHLPTGSGNDLARFPALSGQWPEYTVAQLKAFRDGLRSNDGDGKMMQGVALDLSDKEMEAVANYVFGLSE
ncbi:MAG: cytochrome c4 [Gammaproteobacteria bacterium]|nr:cytochrome c4 [Gammaproteobacteria bacterium]